MGDDLQFRLRDEGVIRNCSGPGPLTWINGRDAGEPAMAAIPHPERVAITSAEYARPVTRRTAGLGGRLPWSVTSRAGPRR